MTLATLPLQTTLVLPFIYCPDCFVRTDHAYSHTDGSHDYYRCVSEIVKGGRLARCEHLHRVKVRR